MIRAATVDDLPAIAEIQGSSSWDPRSYLDHDCSVAVSDGKIAGFLVSRHTVPDEREILNIAVAPPFRRQGIAKELLQEQMGRWPSKNWFLEVRESNVAAINLYESIGFRPSGRRPDYYTNPAEAAIVMSFFS